MCTACPIVEAQSPYHRHVSSRPKHSSDRGRPSLPARGGASASRRASGPPAAGENTKAAPLDDHARHAVIRVLVRQARLYPEFDLTAMERIVEGSGNTEEEPEASVLSDLDRAFAHAIYDAVVRRWLTLEFLIQRSLTQQFSELEPRLKAVLLAASAQILFMDKVPTHSAINHAVEWAKRVIRPGAGAFANAVLRKVALLKPEEGAARRERYTDLRDELPMPDGSAMTLTEACLPENDMQRLAVATSHPIGLLRHWLNVGAPIREVRRLALHSIVRPPTILNTAYIRAPLPASGHTLVPHELPGSHVSMGSGAELAALLSIRTDLWVQDPASSLAVKSIAHLRPSLILDLCAGQGTKTRQLAATFPNAKVVATDVDATRFGRLQRAFGGSAQVSVLAPKDIRAKFIGKADLILLDVPCSNTGVLARRPEARYRFDIEHLNAVQDTQKQIIADAMLLLLNQSPSSRGKILYSTCSLEQEENQKQAAWADKWHKLGVSREHRHLPTGEPGDPAHRYTDGSFAALLG